MIITSIKHFNNVLCLNTAMKGQVGFCMDIGQITFFQIILAQGQAENFNIFTPLIWDKNSKIMHRQCPYQHVFAK